MKSQARILAILALLSISGCGSSDSAPVVAGTGGNSSVTSVGNAGGNAGTGAGGVSGAGGATCAPPASGDPCDSCEAQLCCDVSTACYNDDGCTAADDAKDKCEDAPPDGGVSSCWETFKASGPLAVARWDCLAASCKALCLP